MEKRFCPPSPVNKASVALSSSSSVCESVEDGSSRLITIVGNIMSVASFAVACEAERASAVPMLKRRANAGACSAKKEARHLASLTEQTTTASR
jgi:hypothetical protein